MNYEGLLQEANNENLYVIEKVPFNSKSKGLIKGDVIGLNNNINTDVERACVLAEELGHHHTSVGDITDLTNTINRKQERKARLWAFNRLVGLNGIISGYKAGCTSRYEFAKHLGVTEEFLNEAIETYTQIYSPYVSIDNYTVFFTPSLCVMEIFENMKKE